MHSTAVLWCTQCHVNHMTLDAPNQINFPTLLFVGRIHLILLSIQPKLAARHA